MSTLTAEQTSRQPRTITPGTVFRGLLWREWLLYRYSLSWMLSVWLIGVCILVLFTHPLWVAVVASVFPLWLGPSMAGGDTAEGSEEFAFALPVDRRQMYLARMVLGVSSVLVFSVSALLFMHYDVPQRLWGLLVESGLTQRPPREYKADRWAYILAVLAPQAFFGTIYWNAAMSRTPRAVNGSGTMGIVMVHVVAGLAAWFEAWRWKKITGDVVFGALIAMTLLPLISGYIFYGHKEVGGDRSQG